MLDSHELMDAAWDLADKGGALPPDNAYLRRAVSTAYYAVFHMLLGAGAERFVGAGRANQAAYTLMYRSFNHGRMLDGCRALQASTLKGEFKTALGRDAVSFDMQDVAASFTNFHGHRQKADYDPGSQFQYFDVFDILLSADLVITAFKRVLPAEKTDVLALLLVGTRK